MYYKTGACITICFAIYLSLVWGEFLSFYRVKTPPLVSIESIESSRHEPADKTFDAMLHIDDPAIKFSEQVSPDFTLLLNKGSKTQSTAVSLLPFSQHHTEIGTSYTKLAINSLGVVNLLLRDYEGSADPALLTKGLRYTLAYAQWDMDHSVHVAFNNNDHAVASRSIIVSRLWYHYRRSELFQTQKAKSLLDYASYLAAKLLNEKFYTYHSNHGTMQNLALMILGSGLRALPQSSVWLEVGLSRLEEQIGYLLSDDGFFLEHSFGYHIFFTDMLATASNILRNDSRFQSDLVIRASEAASKLTETLTRTDGSLPSIGDTRNPLFHPHKETASLNKAPPRNLIYPVAGFAQIRHYLDKPECNKNEIAITMFWSNYIAHAHHRLNSGTLDVFACNSQWWRDSGYVPYWHFARPSAQTWEGANGPYLSGETRPVPGDTELIGMVESEQLNYLHLKRATSSTDDKVEREVFHFASVLVIVDNFTAKTPKSSNVHWTMAPDKAVKEGKYPDSYVFTSRELPIKMFTRFLSASEMSVTSVSASPDTVLGWVEFNSQLEESTTFNVKSAPGLSHQQVSVSVLMADDNQNCQPSIAMEKGEENKTTLELVISGCGMELRLTRRDRSISLKTQNDTFTQSITPVSRSHESAIERIKHSTQVVAEKYGKRFNPLLVYRQKASLFASGILIATVLMLILCHRSRWANWVASGSVILWIVLPLWVHFIYFA